MSVKKILLVLLVFVIPFLLVGCASESKEVKLCKELIPKFDEFSANRVTYGKLRENLQAIYDKYCPDAENSMCPKTTYDSYEISDCTQKSEYTKGLCEANNERNKKILESYSKDIPGIHAFVTGDAMTCQELIDKG